MVTSRLLGAGNFGSVYLATTRSKQVACKIVNPSSDADRGSRRSDRKAFDSWVTSVRQEIDILAKLSHVGEQQLQGIL
jgi:serine/threonine protein kinase